MSEQTEKTRQKKQICVGLLAHVDAGKTTLAEAMLYKSGSIRKAGRVDHGDAFLDTNAMERSRGITIFSKQARLETGDLGINLLDTPGHVDFSAEMERTLQVLDMAILVISGADGVQAHVKTLWRLLERYEIPVFLFVNKMDQPGTDRVRLMEELKSRLHEGCVCFSPEEAPEEWKENLAVCEESLLERYLETGTVSNEDIVRLIAERKTFPCFFGSALRMEGVEELLQGLEEYTADFCYPKEFGARVFKIARDEQGTRLTYMKITGGSLKVKAVLSDGEGEEAWEQKADQLRLYSGTGFQAVPEVEAGMICAVTGPDKTYAGEGLGFEREAVKPLLEPVLTYELLFDEDCDLHGILRRLRQLEEEDPMLHILWQEQQGRIYAQVMGSVQMEVLKNLILERCGVEVEFGTGNILYKETIAGPVEGIGHFEPLRHYAEVHLLLEPGAPGSGLQFDSVCSEDVLDRNWQRLILTHLAEKRHKGVLTGSEITDMKITLVTGRAHLKHTEGGDFRQATYRAVRQGLMCAETILLEPVYEFRLEVPPEKVGRAMADLQRMQASFSGPVPEGELSVLTGTAAVAAMGDYQQEVIAYTRGEGRLSCSAVGYAPCTAEAALAAAERIGYDPESDTENPTGSVFCAHGAGFVVPWELVPEYMHVDSPFRKTPREAAETAVLPQTAGTGRVRSAEVQNEDELKAIFERTYGSAKWGPGPNRDAAELPTRSVRSYKKTHTEPELPAGRGNEKAAGDGREYLLVDGYNIIFAWEELTELAEADLGAARDKLMDLLCDYQGFRKNTVILVFDAYRVEGNPGEVFSYHNIHVVYTKEAETADQYIEKTVHEIGKKHSVTVATSDNLEQIIILGQGASRMSARGLRSELEAAKIELREVLGEQKAEGKNYLFHHMSAELAAEMDAIRLGRKKIEDL